MPLFSKRVQSTAVVAFLAFAIGAPAANASVDLELRWWIDGSMAGSFMVSGNDLGNGMFNFAGNYIYLNPLNPFEIVELGVNLNGKPDANAGTSTNLLISGNLAVENLFSSSVDVLLEVVLPVASGGPGTLTAGSAAIGLTTNADGGSLLSLPGTPVWQGTINGSPVGTAASLFHDPFDMTNSGLGSSSANANFGIPDPVSGPSVSSSIGINMSFSLTPSDQASITSVFNVVPIPGPGGLLVFAAAGLVTRRRRRCVSPFDGLPNAPPCGAFFMGGTHLRLWVART